MNMNKIETFVTNEMVKKLENSLWNKKKIKQLIISYKELKKELEKNNPKSLGINYCEKRIKELERKFKNGDFDE